MTLKNELEKDHIDRFDEVVKGLKLSHNIAKRLANFIHYEVMSAKRVAKENLRKHLIEELQKINIDIDKDYFEWNSEQRAFIQTGINRVLADVVRVILKEEKE